MVFNRHLKALNRCNHSDTIACVLYELLVNLELIIVGFQTHVQGSTSFSFVQFSRSCCAVASPWQLVYYISETLDCQGVFWKFFEEVLLQKTYTGCYEALFAACPPRDSLIIIARSMTLVNSFFGFFDKFWEWFLGKVYIGVVGGDRYKGLRWEGGAGDLAGVRGNKGTVQRRGKPPPYNMED